MTNKPIVSVVLDQEDLEAVMEYQHGNMMKSQSKAIVKLIRIGLEKEKQTTDEEKKFLLQLGKLNESGRERLADIIDTMIKSKKYQ